MSRASRMTSPVITRVCLVGLMLALVGHTVFSQGTGITGNRPPSSSTPGTKEMVAVVDFEAIGASLVESAAITERIRDTLSKTGAFTLVDRSQMNTVLNEQALQQTGCTSQECAVQVGRLLGVRKIVSGRLIKISAEEWLVSALLVDVETSETLSTEATAHQGEFFTLLDTRITELVEGLTRRRAGQSGLKQSTNVQQKPSTRQATSALHLKTIKEAAILLRAARIYRQRNRVDKSREQYSLVVSKFKNTLEAVEAYSDLISLDISQHGITGQVEGRYSEFQSAYGEIPQVVAIRDAIAKLLYSQVQQSVRRSDYAAALLILDKAEAYGYDSGQVSTDRMVIRFSKIRRIIQEKRLNEAEEEIVVWDAENTHPTVVEKLYSELEEARKTK